jgi:hypothetical protein
MLSPPKPHPTPNPQPTPNPAPNQTEREEFNKPNKEQESEQQQNLILAPERMGFGLLTDPNPGASECADHHGSLPPAPSPWVDRRDREEAKEKRTRPTLRFTPDSGGQCLPKSLMVNGQCLAFRSFKLYLNRVNLNDFIQ